MQLKKIIKDYWFNGLIIGIIALLLFVPATKVWLLEGLMDIGLFRADAQRETPAKDSMVPPLYFTGTDNRTISTNDLKGKVVFINFWAAWCPPCRAEMPSINALYLQMKDDPRFVFIEADADGNLQSSLQFMQDNHYSLPVYKAAGAIPANIFSGALPTTVIIDAGGQMANHNEGVENYNTQQMLSYMKSLFSPAKQ